MARRDLAAVWTILESSLPDTSIEAVGLGYEVAAGELLAGIDGDGYRYLLVPLLPGEAARIDTRGRAVHLIRLQHAGIHYLAVKCLSRELDSVFTQFSRELVTSVEDAGSPAKAAADAFDRWRALFSDAVQRALVGESQLIGLLGELLTLEALLIRNAPGSLDYWRGPAGEPQDFRTPSHAAEVKTTLVHEGRIVKVSSVDQLDPPPNSSLCLIHHRLERDPGGFNISEVTERLTSLGASSNVLGAGLAETGVYIADLGAYAGRRYRLVETRTYDVTGPSFPRITRNSFLDNDLPPGTLRLSYSIDLTNEPPSPLGTNESDEAIHEMATEAAYGMGS